MTRDPLFEGDHLRLAPFDADRDAETEARWTHDPEFMRLLSIDPVRPLSVHQVKKKYEEAAKNEQRNFAFALRTLADDRLVGLTRLEWIEWNHGAGRLVLGIADPADRRKGYGTDALRLIVRYALDELNLFRLTIGVAEYNSVAQHFLERHGFVAEVRRREAIHREGRRWDDLLYGLLRTEWKP